MIDIIMKRWMLFSYNDQGKLYFRLSHVCFNISLQKNDPVKITSFGDRILLYNKLIWQLISKFLSNHASNQTVKILAYNPNTSNQQHVKHVRHHLIHISGK